MKKLECFYLTKYKKNVTCIVINYLQFLLIGAHSGLNGLARNYRFVFQTHLSRNLVAGKGNHYRNNSFLPPHCEKSNLKLGWDKWGTFAATCLVHTFCNGASRRQPARRRRQWRSLITRLKGPSSLSGAHNLCPYYSLYLCFYGVI